MKTCHKCLQSYWTVAKRTPKGICLECLKKTNRAKRKPAGYLTKTQAKKRVEKMKKECKRRIKNETKRSSKSK